MIMQDSISALQTDIQQCVVNNCTNFKSRYRTFFFDKTNINLVGIFGMLEKLEIFPDETLMGFKAKIADDLGFSEEEMIQIKRNVWQFNSINLLDQINNSKKTEIQKRNEEIIAEQLFQEWLDSVQEDSKNYAKPTESQKQSLKAIKKELDKIGFILDYEEHKEMIMLCGNFEYLKFTKQELRLIVMLIQNGPITNFLIAPSYNEEDEDDEECKGIRIVISIDLGKED